MESELEKLKLYISMDSIPKSWSICYYSALNKFEKNWLNNFDFKMICDFYNLSDEFTQYLLDTIKLLQVDDTLNFVCYLFYYILYYSNESYDIWSWNTSNVFSNHGNNMIPVISLLAGHPIHIQNMQERNYNKEQVSKHKQNICRNIMNDFHSINGLRFRHMVWLSIFIKCNIIEVGRLQYNYQPNVKEDYLNPHKYHIELHIPGGSPLTIKEVQDSLKESKKYIYSYFDLDTNKDIEYYVESWLLSPELKYFLSEDSNILNFQKLFHIVKYEENLKDFMLFVFNIFDIPNDFTNLKEETSLQRNMKNYLLDGKKIHIGTAILI